MPFDLINEIEIGSLGEAAGTAGLLGGFQGGRWQMTDVAGSLKGPINTRGVYTRAQKRHRSGGQRGGFSNLDERGGGGRGGGDRGAWTIGHGHFFLVSSSDSFELHGAGAGAAAGPASFFLCCFAVEGRGQSGKSGWTMPCFHLWLAGNIYRLSREKQPGERRRDGGQRSANLGAHFCPHSPR